MEGVLFTRNQNEHIIISLSDCMKAGMLKGTPPIGAKKKPFLSQRGYAITGTPVFLVPQDEPFFPFIVSSLEGFNWCDDTIGVGDCLGLRCLTGALKVCLAKLSL